MNLCKHGHDKDVVGRIKSGKNKNGTQRYVCRECKRRENAIQNPKSNKRPEVIAQKWLYQTTHMEQYLEQSRRWYAENTERRKATQRRYRQRVKRAGGKVAYFWQQQARKAL